MNRTEKTLSAFFLFLVVASVGLLVAFFTGSFPGQKEKYALAKAENERTLLLYKTCKDIQPGVTLGQLEKILGPSHNVSDLIPAEPGYTVYYFDETPREMPEPFKAKVNNSTNEVVDLYCGDEGPSIWKKP